MMHRLLTLAAFAALLLTAGCRGSISDEAPIHPNLNMDFQEKFQAQEANPFFADGRAMRPPVPGTVARGLLRDDAAFHFGRQENGGYVDRMPVPITREIVVRGRERYNIFCAVCHGKDGYGQGIIMTGNYGYTPAPSYHDETVRARMASDGYVYDVIANGVRNMPGYAQQIPVADRWAIVAYIRALQLSQNAAEGDIPPSILAGLQQQGPATN
ncbi:MAG: cytochrome c [Rhodothermales bacterium]|nr:cytochrome c [Rhodothermales bacterium]